MTGRAIPSVDRLLTQARADGLDYPRPALVDAVRAASRQYRSLSTAGQALGPAGPWILHMAQSHLETTFRPSLRRVVNATGIVLHTNLGRAPLAEAASQAITTTLAACNLELDLASGRRGSRNSHTEALLCRLSGAEASLVVNNGAAGCLLMLDTLGHGREVIVSRGELVEIGGSFRLPDILAHSGATLVEVGTTNKTCVRDYEVALSSATGLLLKSHRSNFRQLGFTHDASLAELVRLGRRFGVPVAVDLGSGLLVDLKPYGIDEPTVPDVVAAGPGLVCFSGDKLLGGPQAGVLVGSKALIARCRRHPLMRALRIDKLIISALEATLRAYLDPQRVLQSIPVLRMLTTPAATLEQQAHRLRTRLAPLLQERASIAVEPGQGEAGGGTFPARPLPTYGVSIRPHQASEADWESRLRSSQPAVLCRIRQGALWLDVRTLSPGDDDRLLQAFAAL